MPPGIVAGLYTGKAIGLCQRFLAAAPDSEYAPAALSSPRDTFPSTPLPPIHLQ